MNALVGNFCIACLNKQLYRATVSRDGQWGSKRVKCRVCGQGDDDGRNQIRAITDRTKLAGARRYIDRGETALVPAYAITCQKGPAGLLTMTGPYP